MKKLSMSEAGYLGYLASKETIQKQKELRIQEYNKHPKICPTCGKVLPYEKADHKYCNTSCSTIMNNKLREKKETPKYYCLNCGKELSRKNAKYCSNKCQWEASKKETFTEIEKVGYFPHNEKTNETNRSFVRKYLINKYGHKCSICGLSEWQGHPIPLVADHIDGDTSNHKISNFRMVCENCNALLPTYKSKNRKSKRQWRKKYYN